MLNLASSALSSFGICCERLSHPPGVKSMCFFPTRWPKWVIWPSTSAVDLCRDDDDLPPWEESDLDCNEWSQLSVVSVFLPNKVVLTPCKWQLHFCLQFFFFFSLPVLRMEPRASCVLCKHLNTQSYILSPLSVIFTLSLCSYSEIYHLNFSLDSNAAGLAWRHFRGHLLIAANRKRGPVHRNI
jgi:hypothetical protein